MAAQVQVERRKKRIRLSEADQDFLNRVRQKVGEEKGKKQYLDTRRLSRYLRIHDRYLSRSLFRVMDADSDGRISEDDVLHTVSDVVLGSDQRKLKFVFDLHDADGNGKISSTELDEMLKTGLRRSHLRIASGDRKKIVQNLLKKSGSTRTGIDFSSFRTLLSSDTEIRRSLLGTISAWFGAESNTASRISHMRASTMLRYLFVVVPYYAWRVLLAGAYVGANIYFFQKAFFAYRAAGANIYIQIARGGGACLNFNGMLILIPMMRTLLTWIRKTVFAAFVPVDQNIEIHKIVGRVMFFFALLHTGAHMGNYMGLDSGIVQNLFFTRVGLTGVIIMGVFILMWFFSLQFIRKSRFYPLFSFTHIFYWIWFPVAMLHARSFIHWTWIPVAGFLLELLIRRFIKREHTLVSSAVVHDSGVTHLKLRRPGSFQFNAGDYLFLRIPEISHFGWHPFTISSAPEDEKYLGLHIRRLGNWTGRLYNQMKQIPPKERQMPAVIHGPYGAPSAGIFNSRYAILVGAGIGVTPFASILESIVRRKQKNLPMRLKKVYFFWLYRGQKTFQWFAKLLRDLESQAGRSLLDINIYLTDARIDAATGLLKIGMDLVGKNDKSDVLTGLSSRTNFGRPDWDKIFYDISRSHELKRMNVFFCGPYPPGRIIRIASRKAGFHFRMENF